jgi:hypothetical protein
LSPQDPKVVQAIEAKYSFQTASSITFCPLFFDDKAFPHLPPHGGDDKTKHHLNELESAERVLLHEYMHLPWTRDMNPKADYIGYQNAADVAKNGWIQSKNMPDN